MDDYIKRDDALRAVWSVVLDGLSREEIREKIDDHIATDVVEFVRCGDCIYWDRSSRRKNKRCRCLSLLDYAVQTRKDFFCANGERKEN